MTTTRQGQFEAVSTDGTVADETDSSSHARDSDTAGSYADLIIQISEQSSTTRAAGTRWEQEVVSFLSTDPLYRRRFASVEPCADWAARDAARGTTQDRGVDLIATRHDGSLQKRSPGRADESSTPFLLSLCSAKPCAAGLRKKTEEAEA